MDTKDLFKDGASVLESETIILQGIVRALMPTVVVEIGTFVGASTIMMALAMKENQRKGKIYTVDKTDYKAKELAKKFGVEEYIEFIYQDSREFIKTFDKPIGFCFYDGSPTYGDYKLHYDTLMSKMIPKSIYAVHDYHTRAIAHQQFLGGVNKNHIIIDSGKGLTLVQI